MTFALDPSRNPTELTPAIRRVIFAALFLVALTPLLSTPVLPMIDYYNHFSRYVVLSHLDSSEFLARNYAARWGVLPNIGMDLLGFAATRLSSDIATAKVLIALLLAIQYFGVLAFNRALTGKASILVAVLMIPLLYSFIFTWGFANFLLGLGLAFWGAAWWLKTRDRPALAIPSASLIALVIFITHGVAFALYGLLLGGLELGFFATSKPRSIVRLAGRLAGLAVQALAPAALFLMSPTSKAADGVSNADESIRRLAGQGRLIDRLRELCEYRLATIVRVADSPVAWLDVATFAITLAVIGWLFLSRRLSIAPKAWAAILIGGVLVLVVPPTLFGVGYVADRMPLFLAFVLVGSLVVSERPGRAERIAVGVLGLIAVVRLATLAVSWQAYRDDMPAFRHVIAATRPHSTIGFVNLGNDGRLDPNPRCDMYGPLIIPMFDRAATLFAIKGQQPIAMVGPLRDAAASATLPAPPDSTEAGRVRARKWFQTLAESKFDYALVCDQADMKVDAPASARLVAHEGRFSVFELPHEATAAADAIQATP